MKVAIVGVACRLPGGIRSLDTLWDVLINERDTISEIPAERFDVAGFFHPRRPAPGRSCTFAAGVLEEVDRFDYAFFGLSKKEAEYMDPQQRLLLELAWEALEDAQIRPSSLRGSATGVYIGASSLDASMARADDPCVIGPYSMIGNTLSLLANRISYLLDIRGPSLAIDTACSSSLVALHTACQSLAAGETRLALAGGVHMLLSPLPFVGFSKAHMLSASGRCKVFAADADGYVRAEGGGLLVLKPLSDALADGDRILAVIDKTGVNTDGRTIGIAFPNQDAQMALLRALYAAPDIDARDLGYLEAHGTGTAAGDPVEARAIGRVFSALRPDGPPLLIGSVKSNLGHLEPASGLAGLLKAILVLRHRLVPPNLHLDTPHPDIDFAGLKLSPVVTPTPVPDTPGPTLAGVSSFGFGGTNAHVILEQAPAAAPVAWSGPGAGEALPPLLLSAASPASLRRLAGLAAESLDGADAAGAAAVAGRLALRRDQLGCRLAVAGVDGPAIAGRLRAFAAGEEDRGDRDLAVGEALGGPARLAFAFSGNGGSWSGMGRAFLLADPVAAAWLDRLDAVLSGHLGWSVKAVLTGPPEAQHLADVAVAQPLLFGLQVCLFEALAARGLRPDMVCGHSIGEVAAAYAAGALSLEAACRVIVVRSRLQAESRGLGTMAVVQLDAAAAAALPEVVSGELEIAAVNSSRYVTLTGPEPALDALLARLRQARLVCRRLDLDYPFHSRLLEPIRDRLLDALADLAPAAGTSPFYSTVTGAVCPGTELTADYWWRNVRRPVLFAAATAAALADGARILVEIGPDALLAPFLKACRAEIPDPSVSLSALRRDAQDPDLARHLWQEILVHGGRPDLGRVFPVTPPYRPLPAYPWDREPCQVAASPESLGLFAAKPPAHPLLGHRLRGHLDVWENTLDPELLPFLADHKLDRDGVLPGAAYLEMALAAARESRGQDWVELENVEFRQPMPLAPGHARRVRLLLAEGGDFRIESRELMHDAAPTLHVLGRIVPPRRDAPPEPAPERLDPAELGELLDVDALYRDGREAGLAFGPCFRPLVRVRRRGDTAHARLALRPEAAYAGALLHPCLIDGAFQQLLALAAWHDKGQAPAAYLPRRLDRFLMRRPGLAVFARARLEGRGRRSLAASFRLYDAAGRELARAENCRFSRFTTRDNLARQQRVYALTPRPARHPLDTAPAPLPAPPALAAALAGELAALARAPASRQRRQEVWPFLTAMAVSRVREVLLDLAPAGSAAGLSPERYLAGGLAAEQEAYLRYGLELLADMDLLARDGKRFRPCPCDLPPEPELWREALDAFPDQAELLVFLARWSAVLPDVLRGSAALAALFDPKPDGPLERLWQASSARRAGLDALVALVGRLRRELAPGQPLDLLELGAGSGDLTGTLLARLAPGQGDYLATDPDSDLVERLRARFGGQPGFAAAVLDGDDPAAPRPETLPAGGCDLVLIGGTPDRPFDPAARLDLARALLRPGGLVVVLAPAPLPVRQLLFGLSPDWWSDAAGPGGGRLPEAGTWTGLIAAAGFADATRLDDGEEAADFFLLAGRKPVPTAVDPDPEPAVRRHVLLCDAAPSPLAAALAAALEARLAAAGRTPITVTAGPGFAVLGPGRYRLDPERPEDWQALLAALAEPQAPPLAVVHLMGLDDRQEPEGPEFAALGDRRLIAAGLFTRAWLAAGQPPAALCLVTGGGVPLAGRPDRLAPSQAGLVGFNRVCGNEVPGLSPRLVDVQAGAAGDWPLPAAVREILFPPGERLPPGSPVDPETVLSPDGRYVLRLAPLPLLDRTDPLREAADGPVRLELHGQGRLDGAVWRRAAPRRPGPGEVCLENRAAGVNYRDVMFALGRIPEEALEAGASGPSLGLECAGVVTAVGEGVTDLALGDRVCCLAGGCYDAPVIAPAAGVFPLPEGLSFVAGATIPVAHFTAYYALAHLARLEPGERVLIHGAAGGVGQAAIQVARLLGAEVLATAGSPAKRLLLARQGLEHVFDSRSLDFVDRIRAMTDGRGVDVVLNSIAGETLAKSLGLLAPLGRFLELGKVDFYANSPLRMRLLRRNITFFAIDVDEVLREKSALCRRLFREMLDQFRGGALRPLPCIVRPRAALGDAWRLMQHSGHVGKLVIVPDTVPAAVAAAPTPGLGPLSPEATYLVSGGLGGLGREVARRLVGLGARQLVLVGRSGAASPEAQAAVADLEARGATVTVLAADLADPAAVAGQLAPALNRLPRLAGLVHCAGCLRDATIANLTPDDYRAVLRAKTVSAWNLHRLTRGLDLDFFVLFSSATTVLGNPGQANYVAANTGLEALAAYRRSLGLAATSFGWGPVTDTGMLAARPEVLDSLRRLTGAVGLCAADVMDFVELYTRSRLANLHVFRLRLRQVRRLPYVASPVYAYLTGDDPVEADTDAAEDVRTRLRGLPPHQAVAVLAETLTQHFARILRLPASRIRHDKPLGELGMDSLMYVELGLATEETFGVDISALSLDKNATILSLASLIHQQLDADAPAAETRAVAERLRRQHGINLSEETARRLLGETQPPTS